MSLHIDDRTVIGVFALGQWFEIVPNSIRMDAYEFAYYQAIVPFGEEDKHEKSLEVYPMGDMYRNTEKKSIYSEINSNSNTYARFLQPSSHTGFEFECADTKDKICFPLTEIKAFRYKPELNTNLYPKDENNDV